MQMIGVARLGRDAELRYTPNGTVVANLSLAFNYGKKDDQGNRPTQWVDASLWGKLAESLEQYLKKGQQVSVTLDEPHIETYQGQNGQGHKLAARVLSIELVGGRQEGDQHGQQRPQQQSRPAQQSAAQRPASGAAASRPQADDMDDDLDIPF